LGLEVDLSSDESILVLMREVTERLLNKKVPAGIAKVVGYYAQTAHKILSDKSNFEGRIAELERIAGIKINLIGAEQGKAKSTETAIVPAT